MCLYGGKCLKPWTNDNRGPNWICQCPASRTGPDCAEDETLAPPAGSSSTTGSDGEGEPTTSSSTGGKSGGVLAILVIFGLVLFAVGFFHMHSKKGKDPKKFDTEITTNPSNNIMPYSDGSYGDNAANDAAFTETTPPSRAFSNVDIDSTNQRAEHQIV